MDRMMEKYGRQKAARDILRAKYGQLSPSPPRAERLRSPSPPPAPKALPRKTMPRPPGEPLEQPVHRMTTLRNWEASMTEASGPRPKHGPRPVPPPAAPTAVAPAMGGAAEADEAGAAFEARLAELLSEEAADEPWAGSDGGYEPPLR
eukprot:TRINITY_DN3967_c0_g1_i1.p2 TRINITY_DN3967_c0_g1~~TRINITY_DN3967_c0_g1_i1.p2  ORF type:complete len:148 (-),score=33.93 TRINITY_DN3967_c0_g1_i1:117-560(-)